MINFLRAVNLCQRIHCKLKPAVAVAALIAGSLFGSTAQAEFVQFNWTGTVSESYTSGAKVGDVVSGWITYDNTQIGGDFGLGGETFLGGYGITSNFLNMSGQMLFNQPGRNFYFFEFFSSSTNAAAALVPFSQNAGADVLENHTFFGSNFNLEIYYSDGYVSNLTQVVTATFATPSVPVSAVPEPASWALSLAGLGIVGALHRRRRSASAALA